jgi:DegV family protein with EDD domain
MCHHHKERKMRFKIVGDSCCDFTAEDLKKEYVANVPLSILVGETDYLDDETLLQEDLLLAMSQSGEGTKSACPSPRLYMDAYAGADEVYVVTLSRKLSGSYASAEIARDLFQEEHEDVKVHVFDSKSAAAAQYAVYKRIEELVLADTPFEEVVSQVEAFIEEMDTIFVLENLENMRKNGRISKVKASLANALNIKPVLTGVDGEIEQLDQARGMNKALNRMMHHIERCVADTSKTRAYITHCACINRALNVKKLLMEQLGFTEVTVLEARGISTVYANQGGVIVAF